MAVGKQVTAEQATKDAAQQRTKRRKHWRVRLVVFLALLVLSFLAWHRLTLHPKSCGAGRLYRVCDTWVVQLEGEPADLGRQHGRLLRNRLSLPFLGHPLPLASRWIGLPYESWQQQASSYEDFIPAHMQEEMRGIARGAGVDYLDILTGHTFLEPLPGRACSAYAVFGRATATGELVVGYNLEHHGLGVAEKFTVIFDVRPTEDRRLVSIA